MPTVESALQSRKRICLVSKSSCKKSIRSTRSSRTSVPASTSSENHSVKWFNSYCEELSKSLWYPTEIDSVESPLVSLSGCVQSTTRNSWSKIKTFDLPKKSLPKTYFPSFTSSAVEDTVSVDTKSTPEQTVRARKVKILPTKDQEKILRGWFRDARKIYNRVIHQIRTSDIEVNKFNIRNLISTPATSEFPGTPSKILHQAAFDAYEAYHSNMEKMKIAFKKKKSFGKKKRKIKKKKKSACTNPKSKIKRVRPNRKNKRRRKKVSDRSKDPRYKKRPFNIKFKPSKGNRDSIGFQKCGLSLVDETHVRLFPRTMKDSLKISRYSGEASLDPRICRIHGRYYFCFPEKVDVSPRHTGLNREVSIDPGMRKFISYYSPSGTSGFIGQGSTVQRTIRGSRGFTRKTKTKTIDFINPGRTKNVGTGMYRQMDIYFSRQNRIKQDMKDLDNMYTGFSVSEKKTTRKWYRKKKYSLRKAWYRLMSQASSRMDDFHWKSAQFLLENFDTVYIPKFQVQNMTRKGNLNVKTRKRMLYQKHYSFRQKLIHKANILGKTVVEGSEWGTTKCCGVCGLRNDPGSSEVYSCSRCFVRGVERDLHGARNYYIKEKSRIQTSLEESKKRLGKKIRTEVSDVVDSMVDSIVDSICPTKTVRE